MRVMNLLRICIVSLVASAVLVPQDGHAGRLRDGVQAIALRSCKTIPGEWRPAIAVLSLVPQEAARSIALPRDEIGNTPPCIAAIRKMICWPTYMKMLEDALNTHRDSQDEEMLGETVGCGAVGIAAGVVGSGDQASGRRGRATSLCKAAIGLYRSLNCDERAKTLFRLASQVEWPRNISTPGRFVTSAIAQIERSALTADQKLLLQGEMAVRIENVSDIPNLLKNP